jgi:integrase/recombinase XerD
VADGSAVSALRDAAGEYLALRRALGFKLRRADGQLFGFVDFLEAEGATRVTTELALRWATLPRGASPGWWNSRLCVARGFARHMSAIDPATEVPPTDVLMRLDQASSRAEPYLYSPEEVVALLGATRSIRGRFVALTCESVLGLLAVSGMRIGEALRLDVADLDWGRGVVIVSDSKFNRSREVPLHESTIKQLRAYARLRDERYPQARSSSFFVTRSGRRLGYGAVREHFEHLVQQVGLLPRSARCRPRLHDFRHSFACATLEDWYRAGVDVQAKLPLLSTYLGHVDPISTYWYLSGKPELLALAADRLEAALGALQ